MNQSKKLAIVTGGGSGIGLATTETFVENGIQTVIIGRDENKLKEASAKLGKLCAYRTYDLSDTTGLPELISEIVATFGAPDILVNNAGINMKKPFIEVTDDDFKSIIQTNLNAVFSITREVV